MAITPQERPIVTFVAPTPEGDDVMFGRGDLNNPKSDAQYALAYIATTPRQHEAIVANLDAAAGGEPITIDNAALVLSRAVVAALDTTDTKN
ncbi:MAG TPA: hypothetical protein VLG37_00765 [Candidatus Saccharimonadales bacterium]|nr:hypothetical protein [Candidatus Saccharimonadales bacterium]